MDWEFLKIRIKDNWLKMLILFFCNNYIFFWIMILLNCDIMIFLVVFKCIMLEKMFVIDVLC